MQPEVSDGTVGRWSGQRERRREEFVDAALIAIAEHGPQTSTEQIAVYLGIARTKLYRYFTDAADLQRAVAQRAGEMLVGELAPVWEPQGSMAQILEAGVSAHVNFLVGHRNLYRYLARCSLAEDSDAPDALTDIKLLIGRHMTVVFAPYVSAFGVDADTGLIVMGIVGMVEAAASHWVDQPDGTTQERLIAGLVRWIWLMIDDTLRAGGVYVDPDEPLPTPDEIARIAATYRDPGRLG